MDAVSLPPPNPMGRVSVEAALAGRRSVREYKAGPLALSEVSQLLWSAAGITNARGLRAAPSAGGRFPLETYLVAGDVTGLPSGTYKYRPREHDLVRTGDGDRRGELCGAALGQEAVRSAPGLVAFSAVYGRTTAKYGERGVRYVHMDVGHAAENVCLQAVALGLGTVIVGAFEDAEVARVLGLPADEEPLYLVPVGRV